MVSQRRILAVLPAGTCSLMSQQPLGERQHEAFDIGPGHVLQVAPRPDAGFECRVDHLAVPVHAFLAAFELEFVEDVVVRATGEHARLDKFRLLHQPEVVHAAGADPAGTLRVAMAQRAAAVKRLPVVLGIEEELRLADDPAGASQPAEKVVNRDHLVHGVRRPGLLAVAKGRVRDHQFPCLEGLRIELDWIAVNVLHHRPVEVDQGRQPIVERPFQQVRLGGVDQGKRFSWRRAPW